MQRVFHPETNLASFAAEFGRILRRIEFALADHSIGTAELRLLFEIRDSIAHAADHARSLSMDTGQVTRILRNLEQKGLIERVRPDKGRELIELTNSGRHKCDEVDRARFDAATKVFQNMTESERVRLMQSADTLGQNLNLMEAQIELFDGKPEDTGKVHSRAVDTLASSRLKLDPVLLSQQLHKLFSELTDAKLIIAKRGGDLAGAAFIEYQRPTRTGLIQFICVNFPHEGNGVGAQLLEKCAERARAIGMTALTVTLPHYKGADLAKTNHRWTQGKIKNVRWSGKRNHFIEWRMQL